MKAEDARFVVDLCASRAGLLIDPKKTYLLESRLGPVARREDFSDLSEFLQAVRDRGEERLIWSLVEALSPGAGDFFRDPAVLLNLAQEAASRSTRSASPVRIWVAACGGGQEAYSLAMALQELAADVRFEIVASDLSERRLEKARAGLFTQFEVQRGLSAQRLVRHFDKADELFQISPALSQKIEWQATNLAGQTRPPGKFDLILCRYVLGVMTAEGRQAAGRNLDAALAPGGWLMLAPEESISGLLSTPARPGFHYKAGGLSAAAA